MKFVVIASGSKGNCTYYEHNGVSILIDAGISFRQIQNRLLSKQIDVMTIDHVFITHEHTDHVAGLDIFMKKTNATCHITTETYDSLYFKVKDNVDQSRIRFITPFEEVDISGFSVLPFSVSHDASDAVGYILHFDQKRIVHATDIGYLPAKDFELLENADGYVFESNYDVTLLFTSNRPFYLKQRIDSVKGHMSNTDSAYNMSKLVGNKTKKIVLIHPSRECNTPKKALDTYIEVFNDYGLDINEYNVSVATQDVPTDIFEL
jgi:phosphoribosyl 1,2-cyclic phosphodiesterase